MIPKDFKGRAKRLDDIDLPKIGATIGVGEDHIHAVLDVESRGSGFDTLNRPTMLFEPHIFWRELGPGRNRDKAVAAGLAYPNWRRDYPRDSYPRLKAAMEIDETAALKSASWGLGQVMGFNHVAAGWPSVLAFVAAMCDDEENHLKAMIGFIKTNRLDDEIRRHDWAGFARGYNGAGFAANQYDVRLARAFRRWQGIPDTKWSPADAAKETADHKAAQIAQEAARPAAAPTPPARPATPQPVEMATTTGGSAPRPPVAIPRPAASPSKSGLWSRVKAWVGG